MNMFEWATNILGTQTSSGVIDVVAIRKSNGSIECSPFHVKLNNNSKNVKDTKDGISKIVRLKVNGTPVPLSMKLGRAGEAFFLERTKVITTRGNYSANRRNITTQQVLDIDRGALTKDYPNRATSGLDPITCEATKDTVIDETYLSDLAYRRAKRSASDMSRKINQNSINCTYPTSSVNSHISAPKYQSATNVLTRDATVNGTKNSVTFSSSSSSTPSISNLPNTYVQNHNNNITNNNNNNNNNNSHTTLTKLTSYVNPITAISSAVVYGWTWSWGSLPVKAVPTASVATKMTSLPKTIVATTVASSSSSITTITSVTATITTSTTTISTVANNIVPNIDITTPVDNTSNKIHNNNVLIESSVNLSDDHKSADSTATHLYNNTNITNIDSKLIDKSNSPFMHNELATATTTHTKTTDTKIISNISSSIPIIQYNSVSINSNTNKSLEIPEIHSLSSNFIKSPLYNNSSSLYFLDSKDDDDDENNSLDLMIPRHRSNHLHNELSISNDPLHPFKLLRTRLLNYESYETSSAAALSTGGRPLLMTDDVTGTVTSRVGNSTGAVSADMTETPRLFSLCGHILSEEKNAPEPSPETVTELQAMLLRYSIPSNSLNAIMAVDPSLVVIIQDYMLPITALIMLLRLIDDSDAAVKLLTYNDTPDEYETPYHVINEISSSSSSPYRCGEATLEIPISVLHDLFLLQSTVPMSSPTNSRHPVGHMNSPNTRLRDFTNTHTNTHNVTYGNTTARSSNSQSSMASTQSRDSVSTAEVSVTATEVTATTAGYSRTEATSMMSPIITHRNSFANITNDETTTNSSNNNNNNNNINNNSSNNTTSNAFTPSPSLILLSNLQSLDHRIDILEDLLMLYVNCKNKGSGHITKTNDSKLNLKFTNDGRTNTHSYKNNSNSTAIDNIKCPLLPIWAGKRISTWNEIYTSSSTTTTYLDNTSQNISITASQPITTTSPESHLSQIKSVLKLPQMSSTQNIDDIVKNSNNMISKRSRRSSKKSINSLHDTLAPIPTFNQKLSIKPIHTTTYPVEWSESFTDLNISYTMNLNDQKSKDSEIGLKYRHNVDTSGMLKSCEILKDFIKTDNNPFGTWDSPRRSNNNSTLDSYDHGVGVTIDDTGSPRKDNSQNVDNNYLKEHSVIHNDTSLIGDISHICEIGDTSLIGDSSQLGDDFFCNDCSMYRDDDDEEIEHVSLADIPFELISPEPAGGDFYDSDTDSYLSLNTYDESLNDDNIGGDSALFNIKKYKYRKVLVPSPDELQNLPLINGENEICFEADGCSQLKMQLFVWNECAKIVIVDIESLLSVNKFIVAQTTANSHQSVWSFLGSNNAPTTTATTTNISNSRNSNSKNSSAHMFSSPATTYISSKSKISPYNISSYLSAIYSQGYEILYITQHIQQSQSSISTKEYLQKLNQSTNAAYNSNINNNTPHNNHSISHISNLPPGPVFQSPDSLIRAFGPERTDLFKAAALRGLKSLFPISHNPYSASFGIRTKDCIALSRCGVPEGRIFLINDSGMVVQYINKTYKRDWNELYQHIHEMFPVLSRPLSFPQEGRHMNHTSGSTAAYRGSMSPNKNADYHGNIKSNNIHTQPQSPKPYSKQSAVTETTPNDVDSSSVTALHHLTEIEQSKSLNPNNRNINKNLDMNSLFITSNINEQKTSNRLEENKNNSSFCKTNTSSALSNNTIDMNDITSSSSSDSSSAAKVNTNSAAANNNNNNNNNSISNSSNNNNSNTGSAMKNGSSVGDEEYSDLRFWRVPITPILNNSINNASISHPQQQHQSGAGNKK